MNSPTSQSATILGMKINIQSPLVKWGIVLLLALLHIFMATAFKGGYSGALSILPVAAAGWFFGSFVGFLTAMILAFFYSIILNAGNLTAQNIFSNDFILGSLILALIGGVSGWLNKIYFGQNLRDHELKNQLKEADALSKISIALSEAERVGLSDILQLIVDSAKNLITGAEQAVIHIYDEEKKYLIAKAASGFQEAAERRLQIRHGEGIAGQAITSGQTINITDINIDTRFLKSATNPKFRSLMVTPIVSGEQTFGTISVQSKMPNAFSKHEQDLISSLGVQASIAI